MNEQPEATKTNGAGAKAQKPKERELTTLEGVVDLMGGAFKESQKHVEALVRAIETPARVAGEMVNSYKALAKELRKQNKALHRELRKYRAELDGVREDAWAREQYQLEFAHRADMRGQLLEWLKEKAPEIWSKHQESLVLSRMLKRVPDAQLDGLRSALKLSDEEWSALQTLRRAAPDEKSEQPAATPEPKKEE